MTRHETVSRFVSVCFVFIIFSDIKNIFLIFPLQTFPFIPRGQLTNIYGKNSSLLPP